MSACDLALVCDASAVKGLGHLNRCATLARVAMAQGARVRLLVVGDLSGSAVDGLISGLTVEYLGEEAEFSAIEAAGARRLIIDHYRALPDYQARLREIAIPWAQFDYRSAFPIHANWLINISPNARADQYRNLVDSQTGLLLGPQHAVLRPEFKTTCQRRHGPLSRLLIMLGGGDDRGLGRHLIAFLQQSNQAVAVTMVTTSLNPGHDALRAYCQSMDVELLIEPDDIPRLMCNADVGICTGGTVAFEFASTGLPFISIALADNQVAAGRAWDEAGVSFYAGAHDAGGVEAFGGAFERIKDEATRRMMSKRGAALVDGRGAERIISAVMAA